MSCPVNPASPFSKTVQVKQRLDTLTSLRFFAAALIVFHHAAGLFGLGGNQTRFFILEQGVSFFFVLSGFILAYIYPELKTRQEIGNFWRARIARIWPALLASFIFAFWLFSFEWDTKRALSNLLMINAWIPFPHYYYSYNNVSWSISTEFFFYLVFPFLIYKWEKNWHIKLLVSGVAVILLAMLSNSLSLSGHNKITPDAIMYIHPASRMFEFILGIYIASYWKSNIAAIQWGELRATLYEIGAILLVGASMHLTSPLAKWAHDTWMGPAASQWLIGSGSMLFFGLLIYVMAIGRGKISAWLSHPVLVLLGEISFSLYLLHNIFLRYYQDDLRTLPHVPNMIALATYWVILLLASYLMWALIEMPSRRLILGKNQSKMHGTQVMRKSWSTHLNLNWKTISVAIVLACLVTSINIV